MDFGGPNVTVYIFRERDHHGNRRAAVRRGNILILQFRLERLLDARGFVRRQGREIVNFPGHILSGRQRGGNFPREFPRRIVQSRRAHDTGNSHD